MNMNSQPILCILSLLLAISCSSPTDFDVERSITITENENENENNATEQYEHSISFIVDGAGYANRSVSFEELYLWSVEVRDSIAEIRITGSASSLGIDTVGLLINVHTREGYASASNDGAFFDYLPGSFVVGPIVLARLDDVGRSSAAPWNALITVDAFNRETEEYRFSFAGEMVSNSLDPESERLKIASGRIMVRRVDL